MIPNDARVPTGELILAGIGIALLAIAWLLIRRTYANRGVLSAKDQDIVRQAKVALFIVAWLLIDLWGKFDSLPCRMAALACRSAVVAFFLGIMGTAAEELLAWLRSSSWRHRLLVVIIPVLISAYCGWFIQLMINEPKKPMTSWIQFAMIVLGIMIGTACSWLFESRYRKTEAEVGAV